MRKIRVYLLAVTVIIGAGVVVVRCGNVMVNLGYRLQDRLVDYDFEHHDAHRSARLGGIPASEPACFRRARPGGARRPIR
jgi:hypothetical protein